MTKITVDATKDLGNDDRVDPIINSSMIDKFGVREIYPTKPNGTEWFSSWANGESRDLEFGQRDPFDDIELTGDGSLKILGNEGIAVVSGKAPRIRVVDIDFENVEITLYGKRGSETKDVSYQGFVIGSRSKHYTDDQCYANTLYGRLTYDGRVSFEKELFHGHGDAAQYPDVESPKYIWSDDIPQDDWIGMKLVIMTLHDDDGPFVLLELYRDLTDGKNGGNWEKVLEYRDMGNWDVNAQAGVCNDYPHNKIVLTPGFVFIRNDFIEVADYKKFSIREIS